MWVIVMKVEEVKRNFTIDHVLLKKFKKASKQNSKTYKKTVSEAIELWLKQQRT